MSALRVFKAGAVGALMALAGCGGDSASGPTYTVGGTLVGLASGGSVEVELTPATLTLTSNGPFTFSAQASDGEDYDVAVGTMPTGQTCGILNYSGMISAANVTNVEVYCTVNVSTATLDGTYEIAGFNVNSDTDQLYSAVPFDGNGNEGAATVTTNQAGTFTTSASNAGVYSIVTSGALPALTVGAGNGGAIAADGNEFYWVDNDINGGSPPAFFLGVKPLQTATLSSLAGNWIAVGLTQATTPYDSEGSIAIGADGSFTGSESTLDITGAAGTQTLSGPAGSYTVTNNIVSIAGDSGYLSANGDFAILASVTQQPGGASANYPSLIAAVKQGSGVTLATLDGTYAIGGMGFDTASAGAGSTITAYFDGAGNFTGTAAANVNSSYSSGPWSGTYTVTSSGVLTLTDANGNVYSGGVSADGNVLVAAYLTAGAALPEIIAGFRQ